MKKFLFLLAILFTTPALAQNAPSGSQRVQGVPDGYGDPVQVTIVGANGSGTGETISVGPVATGAAATGAPVPIGGIYNDSLPILDNGDRAELQVGFRGRLRVAVGYGGVAVTDDIANNAITYFGSDIDGGSAGGPALIANTVFDGTAWDKQPGNSNGIASTPGLSNLTWSYANGATGILSNTTTAVTIKSAAGANVRNYIDSCTINTTAFGAAVPLAIRDGAGGTILFAVQVPTGGFLQPVSITFQQPLRGTANTLLEVVTTTANTSGTAWINCQGHTGA